MFPHELLTATVEDHKREAIELARQSRSRELAGRNGSPRNEPSRKEQRWRSPLAFVLTRLRAASAP
jgi:hypothetical protein